MFPRQGVIDLPARQIHEFLTIKETEKIELVARPGTFLRRDVVRHNKEKVSQGSVLPTPSEESVFQHLGLNYRPPEERDH